MELKNRNLLSAACAVAFIAISGGLGIADSQSSASPAVTAAAAEADSFVYFPAQYALNAADEVSEHIQAF
jgi:hypothetical protein